MLGWLTLFQERCWSIWAGALAIDGGNGYARSHQSAAAYGTFMAAEARQRDAKIMTCCPPVSQAH